MLRKNIAFILVVFGILISLPFPSNAQSIKELFHGEHDPIAGNPKGTITIVEFLDYQCLHCINMAPTIAAIIKANPHIRVVFKDLPIRGPLSQFAARAALAANKQGKYYPFSYALLTAPQPLTEKTIFEIAKTVGLDTQQLRKDMDNRTVNQTLLANARLAQAFKVQGTPAFFIGKTDTKEKGKVYYLLGERTLSALQEAIDKAAT